MPQQCCALNCKNKGGHTFPKDPIRREKWESALRIKNFKASRHTRLCAAHFREEDYFGESIYTGYKPVAKFLRKTAIPSIFNFENIKLDTPLSHARKQRLETRSQKKCIQIKPESPSSEDEAQWGRIEIEIDPLTLDDIPKPSTSQDMPPKRNCDSTLEIARNEIKRWIDTGTQFSSKSTQIDREYMFSSKSTQIDREYMFSSKSTQIDREHTFSSKSTQINREHMFGSIYRFEDDDKAVLFYTGIESYEKLQSAYATLHPLVHKIKYYGNNVLNLATENQFFLTLMKLRQNKCNFELSQFYNVSVTTVSNIFITWVNFIYQVWSEISNWPTELVECYMPVSFKKFNKRVFNAKTELLAYCSLVYKGSICDGQEVELKKLMNKCQNGDSIHADGEFTVQDQDDKIIKNQEHHYKGVHIKKIVGLTKIFNILKSDLDPRQVPIANKIFFICFMCCTFRESNKKENK